MVYNNNNLLKRLLERSLDRDLLAVLAMMLLMQGCAIASGMSMDEPAKIQPGHVVRVESITLELLQRIDGDREAATRTVAQEFSVAPERYRIGPGDILQITVWDHPELTIPAGSFREPEDSGQQVGDDGRMYYPYVGVIMAAGMTGGELRVVLTEELSTYIRNPQLDLRVVAYRSQKVYVVGEVNNPGVLSLDDLPLMIADAISLSGGLTENAHKSGVNVSRDGVVHEIDLRALYDYAEAKIARLNNSDVPNG